MPCSAGAPAGAGGVGGTGKTPGKLQGLGASGRKLPTSVFERDPAKQVSPANAGASGGTVPRSAASQEEGSNEEGGAGSAASAMDAPGPLINAGAALLSTSIGATDEAASSPPAADEGLHAASSPSAALLGDSDRIVGADDENHERSGASAARTPQKRSAGQEGW